MHFSLLAQMNDRHLQKAMKKPTGCRSNQKNKWTNDK